MQQSILSLEDLLAVWPPVLARDRVAEYTGGLISPKSLANLDSLGKGPSRRVKLGRRVGYPARDFAEWFLDRAREVA